MESYIKKFKAFVNMARLYTSDIAGSIHEGLFVDDQNECPYLEKGIDSFGVMLKGKSLEQLPKYDKCFESCFLVNNFDKEIELVGDSLDGKKCIPFVNRKDTAYLRRENYKRLNIKYVQLPKVSDFADGRLRESRLYYESLGMETHFLPKKLLRFNKMDFGREYLKKYPNTGIVAIIYALEMIRPKVLWIAGLDYYQSDYLVRRPHANPIEIQQAKMNRTNLVEVTAKIFRRYPETQVNMISYYEGFPEVENLKIFRG